MSINYYKYSSIKRSIEEVDEYVQVQVLVTKVLVFVTGSLSLSCTISLIGPSLWSCLSADVPLTLHSISHLRLRYNHYKRQS